MGTPELVFEIISQGTRSIDMVKKLNTYMRSGVKEFWLVDPMQKTIIIYVFNEKDIETLKAYKNDETAESTVFKGLAAPLNEVF